MTMAHEMISFRCSGFESLNMSVCLDDATQTADEEFCFTFDIHATEQRTHKRSKLLSCCSRRWERRLSTPGLVVLMFSSFLPEWTIRPWEKKDVSGPDFMGQLVPPGFRILPKTCFRTKIAMFVQTMWQKGSNAPNELFETDLRATQVKMRPTQAPVTNETEVLFF